MVWPHPHQPNRPSCCVTADTAPCTPLIQGLTRGHRPAHHNQKCLCDPVSKDACACPVAAVTCGHQTGPLGDACQIEQQEQVCSNSSTKQPSTLTCTPYPTNTRGFLSRWRQELPWLLWSGPDTGQPRAQPVPGSSQGTGAASQSHAGSLAHGALPAVLNYSSPPNSLSEHPTHSQWVRRVKVLFETVLFHIRPWLEHLISHWATDWI